MSSQNSQEPQVPSQAVPQEQSAQGASQPHSNVPHQAAAYNVPAPSKKRFPKWLKIVGIIVLVFIVFIVIATVTASTATKAPQKVSDQFVNHVQSGDTSAAFALTSQSFRQATTQNQLDQLVKQVGPLLQGEEKVSGRAIVKATGIPQTAVLVYDIKTSSGTKYIKVELQKSGDIWQVINFRSSEKPLDTTVE